MELQHMFDRFALSAHSLLEFSMAWTKAGAERKSSGRLKSTNKKAADASKPAIGQPSKIPAPKRLILESFQECWAMSLSAERGGIYREALMMIDSYYGDMLLDVFGPPMCAFPEDTVLFGNIVHLTVDQQRTLLQNHSQHVTELSKVSCYFIGKIRHLPVIQKIGFWMHLQFKKQAPTPKPQNLFDVFVQKVLEVKNEMTSKTRQCSGFNKFYHSVFPEFKSAFEGYLVEKGLQDPTESNEVENGSHNTGKNQPVTIQCIDFCSEKHDKNLEESDENKNLKGNNANKASSNNANADGTASTG